MDTILVILPSGFTGTVKELTQEDMASIREGDMSAFRWRGNYFEELELQDEGDLEWTPVLTVEDQK